MAATAHAPRIEGTQTPSVRRLPAAVRATLGVQVLVLLLFAVHAVTGAPGVGGDPLWNGIVFQTPLVLAAVLTTVRAATVARDRVAWACVALAMVSTNLGELTWATMFADDTVPPLPSLADGFYLGWYPPMFLALALLARGGARRLAPAALLRSAGVALLFCSGLAFFTLDTAITHPGGSTWAVLTAVAYPALDLILLLTLVGGVVTLQGQVGRHLLLLGLGVLAWTGADSAFVVQVAHGGYVEGSLVDAGWMLGATLVAAAAWAPVTMAAPVPDAESRFDLGVTVVAGVALVGMVVVAEVGDAPDPARLMLAGAVVALVASQVAYRRSLQRMTAEHERMSQQLHDEALQYVLAIRQDLELAAGGDGEALDAARRAVNGLTVELRRVMLAIRPPQLAAGEVAASLERNVRGIVARHGVELVVDLPIRAVGRHADLVFAIAREVVTNAAIHGGARRITVAARTLGPSLELGIADDGIGLPEGREESAAAAGHLGLVLVRRRVEGVGGTVRIAAQDGAGTTVTVSIPRR